jgi:hypothetical protein
MANWAILSSWECHRVTDENRIGKSPKEKIWQPIACFACVAVLWIHLDDFGASEFSGGRLTGSLFKMAELGSVLFLMALLLTFFFRRTAAATALAATLLCFPFYLYVLMPGLYRWIFKGEYAVPPYRPFHWDNWAIVGVFSLLFVAWTVRRACQAG